MAFTDFAESCLNKDAENAKLRWKDYNLNMGFHSFEAFEKMEKSNRNLWFNSEIIIPAFALFSHYRMTDRKHPFLILFGVYMVSKFQPEPLRTNEILVTLYNKALEEGKDVEKYEEKMEAISPYRAMIGLYPMDLYTLKKTGNEKVDRYLELDHHYRKLSVMSNSAKLAVLSGVFAYGAFNAPSNLLMSTCILGSFGCFTVSALSLVTLYHVK